MATERTNFLLRSGMGTVAAEDYDPQRHGPIVEESDEEYTTRLQRQVHGSGLVAPVVRRRYAAPPTVPTGPMVTGLSPGPMNATQPHPCATFGVHATKKEDE